MILQRSAIGRPADEKWLNSRFPFLSADCLRVAIALESDLGLALKPDPLEKPEQIGPLPWDKRTYLSKQPLRKWRN